MDNNSAMAIFEKTLNDTLNKKEQILPTKNENVLILDRFVESLLLFIPEKNKSKLEIQKSEYAYYIRWKKENVLSYFFDKLYVPYLVDSITHVEHELSINEKIENKLLELSRNDIFICCLLIDGFVVPEHIQEQDLFAKNIKNSLDNYENIFRFIQLYNQELGNLYINLISSVACFGLYVDTFLVNVVYIINKKIFNINSVYYKGVSQNKNDIRDIIQSYLKERLNQEKELINSVVNSKIFDILSKNKDDYSKIVVKNSPFKNTKDFIKFEKDSIFKFKKMNEDPVKTYTHLEYKNNFLVKYNQELKKIKNSMNKTFDDSVEERLNENVVEIWLFGKNCFNFERAVKMAKQNSQLVDLDIIKRSLLEDIAENKDFFNRILRNELKIKKTRNKYVKKILEQYEMENNKIISGSLMILTDLCQALNNNFKHDQNIFSLNHEKNATWIEVNNKKLIEMYYSKYDEQYEINVDVCMEKYCSNMLISSLEDLIEKLISKIKRRDFVDVVMKAISDKQ